MTTTTLIDPSVQARTSQAPAAAPTSAAPSHAQAAASKKAVSLAHSETFSKSTTSVGKAETLATPATQAAVAPPKTSGVQTNKAKAPEKSPPSEQLRTELHAARDSASEHVKWSFTQSFNRKWAPQLKTEDAAMQFLAQGLAYVSLRPDTRLAMHIKHDVDGVREDSYPSEMRLTKTMKEPIHGLVVHVFEPTPEALAEDPSRNRSVMIFKGTGAKDGQAQIKGDPTGMVANLDMNGIAKAGMALVEQELFESLIMAVGNEGRPVTLTGHSLGGACAARAMAMLPPAQQAAVKLLTFGAPHLDSETADLIKEGAANVRCYQTKDDYVANAGEKALAARYFEQKSQSSSPWKRHSQMNMVQLDLDKGGDLAARSNYIRESTQSPNTPNRYIERARKWLGGG